MRIDELKATRTTSQAELVATQLEANLEEAREKTINIELELLATHERDVLREAELVKTRERAMLKETTAEAEVKAAHERALQAEERAVIAEWQGL